MPRSRSLSVKPLPKRQVLALFCWVLIVISSLVAVFLYQSKAFSIKTVICQTDGQNCPDYLQAEVQKYVGKNIFFSQIDSGLARISESLPSLKTYEVTVVLPHTVQVNFTSAPGMYALVRSGQPFFIVDENGMIIREEAETTLPQIHLPSSYVETLHLQTSVLEKFHTAIAETLVFSTRYHIPVKKVSLPSLDEVRLDLETGKVAQLPLEQTSIAVQKLAYVLKSVDFTQLKSPVGVIDLRYKYPVLRL